MQAHPAHTDVQARGIKVLKQAFGVRYLNARSTRGKSRLAAIHPASKVLVGGGVAATVKAMLRHPDNFSIQLGGATLLEAVGASKGDDQVRKTVREQG